MRVNDDFHISGYGAGTAADPFAIGLKNAGPCKSLFLRRMDTVGNGTGTDNMNVNGSVTPVTFKIAPAAGEIIRIARLIIYVQDTGAIDAEKWGNNITLANGMTFNLKQGGVTSDFLGYNVKTFGEMAALCYDIGHHAFGTGDEFVVIRWTFTKAGEYVRLVGDDGDEAQLIVNDDMTGLVRQYFTVEGYYE